MSDYEVEIEGKYNLAEINQAIAGEEAISKKFISSRIDPPPPEAGGTNFATFRKLSPGADTKPLVVVKKGDTQPEGTEEAWFGDMVVEGTLTSVIAYREV